LACSGAEAVSQISSSGLPKPGVDFEMLQVGEASIPGQAAMLQQFASTHDVAVINLSIGGNDFGFADLATTLLAAQGGGGAYTPFTWLPGGAFPGSWEDQSRYDLVAQRVQFAIENITTAMTNAGKSPDSYKIVYQVVPNLIPAPDDFNPQETASNDLWSFTLGNKLNAGGCPLWGRKDAGEVFFEAQGLPEEFWSEDQFQGDAEWVYNVLFPRLTEAMISGVEAARVSLGATGPKVVVNDTRPALKGHELCARDTVRQTEYEDTYFDYRNGETPTFGPGQGADTEWMNAVGRGDGLLILDNAAGGYVGGFASSADVANSNYLTQVLHPNFWGQRALAACTENAVMTDADYLACEPHPAGGTDAQGRPLMLSTVPAAFTPMVPIRVLDTRTDGGPVAAGAPVEVDLTEVVPAGTTAVSYNVTATGQTASGFAEVAPAGAASGSSTINWGGSNQTIANGHISKLGTGNTIAVTVEGAGTAEIIIDITGAFTGGDGAGFTPTDRRVYDSRDGDGPLAAGQSRTMNINDDIRALADAAAPVAAAVNVTITGTTGSGVLSVAKDQTADTSTINWSAANQTMANAVITDVAEDGTFTVTNNGDTATDVIVDLTGTFTPGQGAMYYAVDPVRAYDSRTDTPLTDTRPRTTALPVPDDAVAVAVNTTITGTTGSGWLAITPGTGAPQTSTVNWYDSPTTRANGSITGLTQTSTTAHVGGFYSTHYLHDITGYFAGGVTPTPVVEALPN
jgi:hypothetical protein